ncbi:hypothetical protein MP638_001500 [Amoeboaphelidium occidentale]|nr:hypothetical protein MP638_001500 [Amoeboaphelidium occidentale]
MDLESRANIAPIELTLNVEVLKVAQVHAFFITVTASGAASEVTDTVRIWVRYRNSNPVKFRLAPSDDVDDLTKLIVEDSRVGLGEYKGAIDAYENEDGQRLTEGLSVGLIRTTTEYTPLIVKIPTSDDSVSKLLIVFSFAVVLVVIGFSFFSVPD